MKIMAKINTQAPVDKSIFKTSKVLIVITIIWAIVNCIMVIKIHIDNSIDQCVLEGTEEFAEYMNVLEKQKEDLSSLEDELGKQDTSQIAVNTTVKLEEIQTIKISIQQMEQKIQIFAGFRFVSIKYELDKKISIPFSVLYIIYNILIIYMFITCYFKFFSLGGLLYGFLSVIIFLFFYTCIPKIINIIKRVICFVFIIVLLINLFITIRYLVHPYNNTADKSK